MVRHHGMIIPINPIHPQPHKLKTVVTSLQKGGVVAYPTDTTYGIGCSIFNKKGIEEIYRMKCRERSKPFSFICASISEISNYARISNVAFKILKRYLPGPYTFVLEATHDVPDLLLTRQKTVGIRIPDNRICLDLVSMLGNPIITTSANISGEEPVGDPAAIAVTFGKKIDFIIDGDILATDVSSVISLVGGVPTVLRSGLGDISWCS